jgi:hypothetical protein
LEPALASPLKTALRQFDILAEQFGKQHLLHVADTLVLLG